MSRQQAGERPAALDAFMAELRTLRAQAGNPSFRQMAVKSGAVSHATLHLTVTGYRLQPWETVREFVRACDGDEQDWQLRWERAQTALSDDPATAPEAGSTNGTPGASGDEPEDDQDRAPWWRSSRLLVPVTLGLVVVVGVIVGFVVFDRPDHTSPARPARAAAPDEPVYRGDASKFVDDVTIPDKTVVKPGAQFVKVWQIQNVGSVHWRDRFLQRTDSHNDPDDCRTPPRIPINDTAPKQHVQITVTVQAPVGRTDCKVYWKMVDKSDRKLLPGSRPIFFWVRVRP